MQPRHFLSRDRRVRAVEPGRLVTTNQWHIRPHPGYLLTAQPASQWLIAGNANCINKEKENDAANPPHVLSHVLQPFLEMTQKHLPVCSFKDRYSLLNPLQILF